MDKTPKKNKSNNLSEVTIKQKIRKFAYDFFTVFLGVLLAFALGQWSSKLQLKKQEQHLLKAIDKELEQDLGDVRLNIQGHESSLQATKYFARLLREPLTEKDNDSLYLHYHLLLRQYITIQHSAAYENLKSLGLNLIQNDSLLNTIVSLYDFHYETILKLEESYRPMQFYEKQAAFTQFLAKNLQFEDREQGKGIIWKRPLSSLPEEERITWLMYLADMRLNRTFMLEEYKEHEKRMLSIQKSIRRYNSH